MRNHQSDAEALAVKDEENERPIPSAWRPIFREVVKAFAHHDYHVSAGVPGVAPISDETASQVAEYIQDYGATLIELPEETWDSSVCMWMGNTWDALIDLWTLEEGRSDLVLRAHVLESSGGLVFHIDMVYVP
ncbi:MAG TPA: hypothetical protein VKA60_09650 [Blastocatellia bacterium]|nr:hypothetical protein [Blastocatellia bacterium]